MNSKLQELTYLTHNFLLNMKNEKSYIALLPNDMIKIIIEMSKTQCLSQTFTSYIKFMNKYLPKLLQLTKYYILIDFESKPKYIESNKTIETIMVDYIIQIIKKDEFGIMVKRLNSNKCDEIIHIKHGENDKFFTFYETNGCIIIKQKLIIQPLFGTFDEIKEKMK